MPKVKYLQCKQCGGEMRKRTKTKHSHLGALMFVAVGVVCCLFLVGAILGIPLILIGVFLFFGTNRYWVCMQCGSMIPRSRIFFPAGQNSSTLQKTVWDFKPTPRNILIFLAIVFGIPIVAAILAAIRSGALTSIIP